LRSVADALLGALSKFDEKYFLLNKNNFAFHSNVWFSEGARGYTMAIIRIH